MLGLLPEPPRGDLKAEVKGTVERPDFVVEKVLYQSIPGLYVTGDLFRPKEPKGRLPAILYVCGHSKVEKDGVILGNKTHYQHHAAWYAANGYVCLVLDTLQLGEVPGLHHGTFREGMWWWQSRGYTPAGVEAWNGVRGIDYLVSRPDVDAGRIGVTGRSGGGATSWWLGAIDDRIAAVAPVAGITDLKNHVVDGVVEGHCDCMYVVNTYRWDYTTVAALVAPKPLLIENTDKDPIFPEDGVRRVAAQVEKVYAWYGHPERFSLVIGKGGHADTEELRHPSFAFFEKWLKGVESARIDEPDRNVPIEELKVLSGKEVPSDQRNSKIHESFVAPFAAPPVPDSAAAWATLREGWMKQVRTRVFGGWPAGEPGPKGVKVLSDEVRDGLRFRRIAFEPQEGIHLTTWVVSGAKSPPITSLSIGVMDEATWRGRWAWVEKAGDPASRLEDKGALEGIRTNLENGVAWVLVLPRGVGPTAWEAKKDVHIRRRFALLGQTLAGMQVWDVRCAFAALRAQADLKTAGIDLLASAEAAPIALWAAVFEPTIGTVNLRGLPDSVREGPAFLNLDRVLGMPQALALLYPKQVSLVGARPRAWRWAVDLGKKLNPSRPWPTIRGEEGQMKAGSG